MSDPILPPEIEYTIFMGALAIKGTSESAGNLVLVARRVHMWLIPKIMETFAIRTYPPAQNYPVSWSVDTLVKYGVHTRNLFVWTSPYPSSPSYDPLASKYISLCPNLTNLVLWSAHSMEIPYAQLEEIAHLHSLTHLSINLKKIPSLAWENSTLLRVFEKITHLHNVALIDSSDDITLFNHFTSLTHLTFPYLSDEAFIPLFLTSLPTLEALIVLENHYNGVDSMSVRHDCPLSVDDPRIVKIACQSQAEKELDEWLLQVQEGQGIWGLADQAIREGQKQKGQL
ncbi:hypothetical protein BDN72DRAFT_959467 [Pluteus cervinus]|uniref:Uncharacterized protein n=1 Tax=Pluteus cervinus TaxID=181527 RepID=A0ACD3AW77_9AGAR|nr:hypothetical protein BDN72DRAFT_959467 [Pluteus cervinus]